MCEIKVSSVSTNISTIISKVDNIGYQVKLHLTSIREDKINREEPKNAIHKPE